MTHNQRRGGAISDLLGYFLIHQTWLQGHCPISVPTPQTKLSPLAPKIPFSVSLHFPRGELWLRKIITLGKPSSHPRGAFVCLAILQQLPRVNSALRAFNLFWRALPPSTLLSHSPFLGGPGGGPQSFGKLPINQPSRLLSSQLDIQLFYPSRFRLTF